MKDKTEQTKSEKIQLKQDIYDKLICCFNLENEIKMIKEELATKVFNLENNRKVIREELEIKMNELLKLEHLIPIHSTQQQDYPQAAEQTKSEQSKIEQSKTEQTKSEPSWSDRDEDILERLEKILSKFSIPTRGLSSKFDQPKTEQAKFTEQSKTQKEDNPQPALLTSPGLSCPITHYHFKATQRMKTIIKDARKRQIKLRNDLRGLIQQNYYYVPLSIVADEISIGTSTLAKFLSDEEKILYSPNEKKVREFLKKKLNNPKLKGDSID